MSEPDRTPSTDAFVRVLSGLLRPLVRTMIARGLTAPVVYGLLKRVFVDVAEDSFGLEGKPLTDSRIALLTGVHRKDIRTFRSEEDDGAAQTRRKSALLATVIGQWMSNPDFANASGQPLPLPRAADGAPSFEQLVQTVSKDVRPRTVLDELERAGFVTLGADDLLYLAEDAIVGTGPTADKEAFFAVNVGDHLNAAAANLLADVPPFFERSVFYNHLTAEAVDQIEAEARVQAQTMLENLNQQSSALHRAEKGADKARHRYRLGVYFYREDADDPAPGTTKRPEDT